MKECHDKDSGYNLLKSTYFAWTDPQTDKKALGYVAKPAREPDLALEKELPFGAPETLDYYSDGEKLRK